MTASFEAYDLIVVGAGIVGLATARALLRRFPDARLAVLEKEPAVGSHQTGRNSGVVHAGIYYPPGSLKARLCGEGRKLIKEYAATRSIPYEECGKVIVAVTEPEAQRLPELYRRGVANGVPGVRLVDDSELRAIEPAVRGIGAVHSPVTAITDFRAIAAAFAADVVAGGGRVLTSAAVVSLSPDSDGVSVGIADGRRLRAAHLVLCAGLWSDRLARLAGDVADPRIVPFRGEYWRLRPERGGLVRGLVYPVPDPRYPFLGVHLTRTVAGEVLVGPNAVLALAREGYRSRDVRWREFAEVVTAPGFRRLARRHWRTGLVEMHRSLSRKAFVREAARFVPELGPADVVPATAGVRAQAVDADGSLVDDFRISAVGPVVAVRNAPSPAATSSLAIGSEIASRVAPG